jgi:hypothetical protein
MSYAGHVDPLKHRFLVFTQLVFWDSQKAENGFAGPVDSLKHRFPDFTQLAFWAGWKVENELVRQSETLKHRFLNLPQIAFGWARRQKMCSQSQLTPSYIAFSTIRKSYFGQAMIRKMFVRPLDNFKNIFLDLAKSNSVLARREKKVRTSKRPFET